MKSCGDGSCFRSSPCVGTASRDGVLGLPSAWCLVPKEQGDSTAEVAGAEDGKGGYRPSALLAAGVIRLESPFSRPVSATAPLPSPAATG